MLLDERLTIHPIDGRKVCGAVKKMHGNGTPLKDTNYTVEDLLKPENITVYKKYICTRDPVHNVATIPGSGRCFDHGGDKFGRGKEGKRKYLPKFSDDEIAGVFEKKHDSLEDELSILSHLINQKLTMALSGDDSTDVLRGDLATKLTFLVESIDKGLFNDVNSTVKELKALLLKSKAVNSAKIEVRQLIKEYSEVFKVEASRRSLSGEYVSKKIIINGYTLFFEAMSEFIPDEQKLNARLAAGRVIRSSLISGVAAEDATSPINVINGLINQNEIQDSYSVPTE